MDVQYLLNGDMAKLVCLLAGLFLVELSLTAAHGPRSAPVNYYYYYYYTHQQRCRDEEKYIETKHIIISMISN